jgi:DnaJ-class molecular chaperone
MKKQTNPAMQSNPSIKNYYSILGVPQGAPLFEIENAYQKLAAKWHPDKHKEHRKTAENRFKEIAEAFDVLSDRDKRAHYDEILVREYSLADANSTFDRFFNEHGFVDESEEKFFTTHFPSPLTNYYNTLGINRNATLEDIKAAYRKLALQYHPKNNPDNEEANKKFVEVNEAYNALSSEFKRQNYDNIVFGTIAPIRAHNIFDDFFGARPLSLLDEDFRPSFHNRWSKDLDRLMLDTNEEKNVKEG